MKLKLSQRLYTILWLLVFLPMWGWFLLFYIPEATNNVTKLDVDVDFGIGNLKSHIKIGDGWKYFVDVKDSNYYNGVLRDEDLGTGFWIWTQHDISDEDTIILEGFQSHSNPDSDPVLLGLRLLVQGKVQAQIVFERTGQIYETKHIGNTYINQESFGTTQKSDFCVEILAPAIGDSGRIDRIIITPYYPDKIQDSKTKDSNSFTDLIIIDKIIITTGEMETNKHLMYTLLPKGWCGKV